VELSCKAATKKFDLNFTKSLISDKIISFLKTNPKQEIILVSNRDDLWVGGGQPWRNLSIQHLDKIISYLLKLGYNVVRFNSVGEKSQIINDSFLDLAGSGASFADQLRLAKSCSINIGAASGVTDIARQIYGKPTIYIETPTLYQYGIQGWTCLVSKRLKVVENDLWKRINLTSRLKFILQHTWDYKICALHGLSIESLDDSSLLLEISHCISLLSRRELPSTQYHYLGLNEVLDVAPPARLSPKTGEMISSLFNHK
jgi:putative glycosyltransferase (TIGR04372 family)